MPEKPTPHERGLSQAVETQMRRWEMARQVEARHQQGEQEPDRPLALTVSRENGARGAVIARAVAERLGWQIYDQELIAYMANQMQVREDLLAGLDEKTLSWSREWLNIVLDRDAVDAEAFIVNLTKVVLAVGITGEAVFVGRGANYILPSHRALTVRIIAPLAERVAYVSQKDRLSRREAQKRVTETDAHRQHFVQRYFHKDIADPHDYDLVLDTSALGEETSADIIIRALEGKRARIREAAKPGRPR